MALPLPGWGTSLLHLSCHWLQAPAPGSLSPDTPQLPSAMQLLTSEAGHRCWPCFPPSGCWNQQECGLQWGRARAVVTKPPGTAPRSPLPFFPPVLSAGPLCSASQSRREQGSHRLPEAGWRHTERLGRLAGGPEGDLGRPSLPGAAGSAAGAAERSPCGMRAQRCKAPPAAPRAPAPTSGPRRCLLSPRRGPAAAG